MASISTPQGRPVDSRRDEVPIYSVPQDVSRPADADYASDAAQARAGILFQFAASDRANIKVFGIRDASGVNNYRFPFGNSQGTALGKKLPLIFPFQVRKLNMNMMRYHDYLF